MKKLTLEQIKEYINKVEPTYTLLSDKYINSKSKLLFKCNKNHIYRATWHDFISGTRCSICRGTPKKTLKEIKKFAKSIGYKLLSKKYNNCMEKLLWKCTNNHIIKMRTNDLKTGYRCRKCSIKKYSNKRRNSINLVKQYINKYNYKLISKKYKNQKTKLILKCNNNHIFNTCWSSFKSGNRCPICAKRQSKGEQEIINYLKSLNIKTQERVKGLIGRKEIDIYLPNYKIGIEYNGLYWHSNKFRDNTYTHYNKYKLCKEKGIILLQIFQDEWKEKQDIIKEIILYFLNPIGKLSNEANNLIYKEENNTIKINNRFPIHLLNKDINEYKEELPTIYGYANKKYPVYNAGETIYEGK